MNKIFTLSLVCASVFFIACGGGGGGDKDSGPTITTNAPQSAVTQFTDVWAAAEELEDITGGFDVLDETKSISPVKSGVSNRLSFRSKIPGILKALPVTTGTYNTSPIHASWSLNDTTGYFEFSMDLTADYTTGSVTIKTGGSEEYTSTPHEEGCDWTYTAAYTYVYSGTNHTISWDFTGSDTESESSMSGTFTFDGSTYNYSESD